MLSLKLKTQKKDDMEDIEKFTIQLAVQMRNFLDTTQISLEIGMNNI